MLDDVNQPQSPEAVAAEVLAVIDGRGIKQATVARETGINAGALSRFLAGQYAGANDVLASKLAAWLRNLKHRDRLPAQLVAGQTFIETPTAADIIDALSYARFACDIALIAGAPGVGKTHALIRYAETRPNAWLVTISPDVNGQVPMLEEIGLALGLGELSGGAAKMRRKIARRLLGTGGILLIDECQHLKDEAIETLRRIHDTGQIALGLAGDERLPEKFDRFAQLYSRIGKRVPVLVPRSDDVLAIATVFGIQGDKEREFLEKVAQLGGGIRSVVKTVRLAVLFADDGAPALQHLYAAWSDLGRGVA